MIMKWKGSMVGAEGVSILREASSLRSQNWLLCWEITPRWLSPTGSHPQERPARELHSVP